MKICVVGTRGFPETQGGVEKHCEILYTTMGKQCPVEIFVYRRKPYIVCTPKYKNIHFVDLPSTRIKGVEAVIHSFLATCASIIKRPDVIHYHNIGPAMFSPLARLFGVKVVMTYHSANYEHKKWGKIAQLLLKISEKIALSCSNEVIFVNKYQMQKSPQKYISKYVYIPNGIPDTRILQSLDFIHSLGLERKKYILAVGRITPEKGFDLLIKAFAKVNTDYKLVIAGGVETEIGYMEELKQLIKPERIVFAGFTVGDKLSQLYSNAGLFVLSSRNEGFPIVLLEAMAYGLNVLVSDIPATHLVDLNKDDYFDLKDEKSLVQGIIRKLTNNSSRAYNLIDFDWKKITQKVYQIYQSLR